MKRILAIAVSLLLLSTVMAVPVLATETTSEVVATYEDGSYLVVTTTEVTNSNARASTTSKYASCMYQFYNGDDVQQWNYTLFANFLYRYGSGAQCQNRGDTWEILKSDWDLASHDTWIDYDSAFGTVTMQNYFLFLPTARITANLSMTCDAYGNITYTC